MAMTDHVDEFTVRLLAERLWYGYQYRARQAEAGRARAASLSPERRREIALMGAHAAAARRAALSTPQP